MKDIVYYARLLDTYGGILTEKQYDMLDSYYCNDLTLDEIAQNHCISKQAVHYAIKNAEDKIEKLESQLHILEKYDMLEKKLSALKSNASSKTVDLDSMVKILDEIINDL